MSVDITIQETVNEVDITVNQNVITVNVTRTTGGGGVQSVTGTTVDNTDPLNPVVNVPTMAQVLTIEDKVFDGIAVDRTWIIADRLKYWQVLNGIQTLDDSADIFPNYSLIEGCVQNDDIDTTVTFEFVDTNCFYLNENVTSVTLNVGDFFHIKKAGTSAWILNVWNKSSGGGTGTVTSVTGDLVDNTDPLNPVVEAPNLAQVLAIDNKTNDIPIVSNNGKAVVTVNDDYLDISYEGNYGSQALAMTDTVVQLYSEVPVVFYSTVSNDFNTPILTYNSEEVATQPYADAKVANDLTASTTVAPSKTAVKTEYDMITGLTFSGAFALDKKGGRSYLPYTQTGSLTLSIGGSPIVGGFAVLRFTANGSAISGYSGWKLLSSDGITATNGVVHRVIVYQYEDEIWYSVKLN